MADDVRARLEDALGDAYTLEGELGGGGMSRVFLATEKSLGRRVVVRGDSDGALRAMETMCEQLTDWWGLPTSPLAEPLRRDPRFQALARRYNIPLESERF